MLTALLTVGLARLGAPQRAIRQLGVEADRISELAGGLPCEGQGIPRLAREFGPRVRFVPDGAPRARVAALTGDQGRTDVGGRESYYVSRKTTLCGRPGSLYVFQAAGDVPALPDGFNTRLVIAGLGGLVGSALVAFILARRMSRPLGELAHSARALAQGSDGKAAELSVSDPAEIAELKEAFGEMVDDLRAAREREESFLLSVSHELRTPLTAIRGYGEALADGTAKQPRKAGEVVARESQRLERLVQDLLDLARVSAGEFSVRPQSVDLGGVAASVVEALAPAAREYGVEIVFSDGESSVVQTDPDRVHQMVSNLVENAMRVTPEGGDVLVEVTDRKISVVDRGPGIDAEDVRHAFERFYLWRRYKGVRPVGSGLGLAIVGELAQRLDVRLAVGSQPGVGSRFELRFDA